MRKKRTRAQRLPALILTGVFLVAVAIVFSLATRTSNRDGAKTAVKPNGGTATGTESIDGETASSTEGFPYIAITESCGPYYGGACVNMRSGPGTEFPSLFKLRNGVVLRVAETVTNDKGETWHKIDPGKNIRHPDRITGDWYVAADASELFYNEGEKGLEDEASSTKRILVSVPKQKLYAFDGGTLFMERSISTGLDLTPTQRGVFYVYWKTPSRYMQGPIEGVSDDVYDLPGVSWNLYFTYDGAVIHGAYWHDNFGRQWSHGCVNLPPEEAKKLYEWADLGTEVIITE